MYDLGSGQWMLIMSFDPWQNPHKGCESTIFCSYRKGDLHMWVYESFKSPMLNPLSENDYRYLNYPPTSKSWMNAHSRMKRHIFVTPSTQRVIVRGNSEALF